MSTDQENKLPPVDPDAPHILLVEDDQTLRKVIAQSLTRRGLNVREAANGLVAKTIFELSPEKYAVILSDVRMPEMDGVALLKIIRAHGKTPFIVMTGFSELIEAKNAFELGANEFLPKPIRTEALLEAIAKCLAPPSATVPEKEPEVIKEKEAEFCQIHVDEFVSTTHLRSDIYLKLGEKHVKVAHKGDAVPIDRIKKYQASSVEYLYVRLEEFRHYVNLNIQVSGIINQTSKINRDSKLRVLKHTAEVIAESCFREKFDKSLFDSASRIVGDTVGLVSEDDDILRVLSQMEGSPNKMYTHAVAVSVCSAIIARAVGWTSISSQSKISLCGLFHDIGEREIDPEIIKKNRLHLTSDEIGKIESHVLRGRDIIRLMPNIPEDVAEVAHQHHENFNGTGYPHNLRGEQIHPMARLVHVADLFIDSIPTAHVGEKVDIAAALAKLEQNHLGEYDPYFFKGLLKALGFQSGFSKTSTLKAGSM